MSIKPRYQRQALLSRFGPAEGTFKNDQQTMASSLKITVVCL
jgi:hypothetical protein